MLVTCVVQTFVYVGTDGAVTFITGVAAAFIASFFVFTNRIDITELIP